MRNIRPIARYRYGRSRLYRATWCISRPIWPLRAVKKFSFSVWSVAGFSNLDWSRFARWVIIVV